MNPTSPRLRTYILVMSALVAAAFFGAGYYAIDHLLDRAVRENARESAETLARTTFAGMYELMRTGWNRAQMQAFLEALRTGQDGTRLVLYRGEVVESDYGRINQPEADAALRRVFDSGRALSETPTDAARHLLPLVAETRCLGCHQSARAGDVLGVIEIRQDFAPLLMQARRDFLFWLLGLAPLVLGMAAFAVWRVSRRLEQSIGMVEAAVAEVERVADLKRVDFSRKAPGFAELDRLFARLGGLVDKLRGIAVDKDVLKFEIRLLEKFVITSDVVRDWGEYIARLLAEINTVMPTHVLFSVFRVDDELFDLEIFWSRPPDEATRESMEQHVRAEIAANEHLSGLARVSVFHHPPSEGETLSLEPRGVVLETKTLLLDRPKIGGIVGIGVHAAAVEDDTLRLVMDSLLSTLLNVVGSVKAIHKYTHDMEYYATRDPLTDLYNRRVFWELLEYEVARAKRQGFNFALLAIDLDHFKEVNDNHGHQTGDRYLQLFAQTVRRTLRPGDIFARQGGDEFVVLLSEVLPDAAAAAAERVRAAIMAMRLEVDDAVLEGRASLGLAVYPLHADNAKDLHLFADHMLYKAKAAGRNQVGLPAEADVAAAFHDLTETTRRVVEAVNTGRIEPWFQPILDLTTGRIAGYEALSRMNVDGESREAVHFIEYAEKAGVIHRLDTLVMEKALHTLAASGLDGLVFLNLSPRALTLAGFVQDLRRVAAECRLAPRRVVFEITERDTLKNLPVLETLAGELKLAGFGLAIDDFGSGYSSFQYLRRLPVDYLKIEGGFILDLLDNERDQTFVRSIHGLAAGLGIQVIAKHVESTEVLDVLMRMGLEMAQGYHIGRPQPNLGGSD